MGCINSTGQFNHWFGNIHLSGPCSRKCYFCIGQHMMDLDPLNNLDEWPLKNIDLFISQCNEKGIKEINLTGSNTDPLLYNHHVVLTNYLRSHIPGVTLGLRTNGIGDINLFCLYDKASISVTTFNNELYKETMGCGNPPNIPKILKENPDVKFKVNLVLCPETIGDVVMTLNQLAAMGIKKVNLREPYGQPHLGCPLEYAMNTPTGIHLGMPYWDYRGMIVTYWDVHYVEVESLNLYANGRISSTYPITKGHSENGVVISQGYWKHGRHQEQWI